MSEGDRRQTGCNGSNCLYWERCKEKTNCIETNIHSGTTNTNGSNYENY